MTLQKYLKHRRLFEVLFWLLTGLITFAANSLIITMDINRTGSTTPLREALFWEGSSMVVILLLVPLILKFDERVPIRWATFPRCIFLHFLFSLVFSLIHVSAMVAIRKIGYSLAGGVYDFGNIPVEFFYEYLKDGRSYSLIVAIIYLYRFILLRLQGEASVLEPDEVTPAQTAPMERLLVKKLGKEFLIHTKDIDYIEAAGNYVNIHIGARIYPLRSTMAKISQQLNDKEFRRIHRSFIVNVNRVSEIQPLESGDATIRLKSSLEIPMSRTYRGQLAS